MATGYQLPIRPDVQQGRKTEGYLTPPQDKKDQVMSVPPRRVIPIIFLPGIMGSNLRMNAERQKEIGKKNNIAWRLDRTGEAASLINADAVTRQQQLDPLTTEVDTYEPKINPTGDPNETADQRHDNVEVKFTLGVDIDTPLLTDDPPTARPRKTKAEKARERGWGEVYFGSYGKLLQLCEERLNIAFSGGKLHPWWKDNLVGVAPAKWHASDQPALQPLTEDELKQAIKGCWFPVHALGYNWLQSSQKSGKKTADRISALIKKYNDEWGFECRKVILVTHSMGGLVARAVIHPEMGKLQDSVLGIVHGVMPAIGAGAAYKRMRCGFEDGPFNITAKVLGNEGSEVTAVLANAPGGLELLPSQEYGNQWLHVRHKNQPSIGLPKNGDPYEEIYKLRSEWWRLFREEWVNPAQVATAGIDWTHRHLDAAKKFHSDVASIYHPQSYAHYGADAKRPAWHHVVWEVDARSTVPDVAGLEIDFDSQQGQLGMKGKGASTKIAHRLAEVVPVRLMPAAEPGDQTVPVHSADHQLRSGKFKGIFRQVGYEHQDSYKDEAALHSTLYSLVRIAQTMKW
jgi:pimeloyl-ACP methyl ester carboxylesterase